MNWKTRVLNTIIHFAKDSRSDSSSDREDHLREIGAGLSQEWRGKVRVEFEEDEWTRIELVFAAILWEQLGAERLP